VAANTNYDPARDNGPFEGSWVLANHAANCRGFDNEMGGILRKLGIPSEAEWGWVSSVPVDLPGPSGVTSHITWSVPGTSGEMHTWLNIYFPSVGWVPFDPQHEKFFVDTRHIGLLAGPDTGDPLVGSFWSDDGAGTLTGPIIVPGFSPGSVVTLQNQDDFHVGFVSARADVSNVLLFSR
jgi:transglutaminase-like putative cysteine protease